MSARRGAEVDERTWLFDVQMLEPGDTIEIYEARQQRWRRGLLMRKRAGTKTIVLADGSALSLDEAVRLGLRRVLN